MHHPHPILVTGAAGRVGARGPVVTKALLDSTYLGATTSMVVVCEHHGVDAFVNMSQMTVSQMGIHETTDSPQHKQQWLAEQVLRWSGLPVVYMRPTAFMEVFFLAALFPDDQAEQYSSALGRKISHVDVPVEPWEEELRQSGMSPHVAAHLITMAALHRQNRYDRHTDLVEKLTGSPAMPIADFVRMHAAEFEGEGGRA